MPLILLTGFPSSGKTTRANELVQAFENKISNSADSRVKKIQVHHISDHSLGISRDVYTNAKDEKNARAALYSAVKRVLTKDAIVICDSGNYIKGYRYQLFCEAKAVQTTSCVVHVAMPVPKAKEVNASLLQNSDVDGGYEESLFDALVFRYEEPNGMSRWDSPLFTVFYEDASVPFDAIWDALIGSDGNAKVVRPNQATVLKPAAEQGYLQQLDKITSDIVSAVVVWQKDHSGEEGGEVKVEGADDKIELPSRSLGLPQLQRIRRQFIALNRQHNLDKGRITPLFVDYLNDQFRS